MKDFIKKVGDFFVFVFSKCKSGLNFLQDKAFGFLNDTLKIPRFSELTENIIFYAVLAVVVILVVLILVLIFKPKKRKYTFIIDGNKVVKKFKKKENIPYPEVALSDDEIMAGWFSDAGYNKLFDLQKAKKRKLKLYAKIVKADSMLTGNPALSAPAASESVSGEALENSVAAQAVATPAETETPVKTEAETAAQVADAGAQKFCPECGAKISADAAFCVQCGARIGHRGAAAENKPEIVKPAEPHVEADNFYADSFAEKPIEKPFEKPIESVETDNASVKGDDKDAFNFAGGFSFGGAVQESSFVEKANIVEEQLEITRPVMDIGEIYDEIRYELLGYERAKAFNKLGSAHKKFIAEMFEKDGNVYLYLAADPDVLIEKGYRVEKHNDVEFKVVPTKKVITGAKDYQEVMALIKETMAFNNLVKSEVNMATKTVSDETARKNGFAFFIKNEVVATAAQDYYKLLRANVLSYSVDKSKPFNEENSGKMILKIFKKGEKIFVYLTLDASRENLEFVGYDKNFADTPAMFEVATLDDLNRAYALIDKVMFRFGMEKHPENAELSLDESLKENCGFGYRIRN